MTTTRTACLLLLALLPFQTQAFDPKSTLFDPPDRAAAPVPGQSGQVALSATPPPPPPREGIAGRSLRGILLNDKNSFANVDGELIRLDDSFSGWRLVKLTTDSAIFKRQGRHQTLVLQRPLVAQETPVDSAARPPSGVVPEGVVPEGAAASVANPAALLSTLSGSQAPPSGSPLNLPQGILNKLIGAK